MKKTVKIDLSLITVSSILLIFSLYVILKYACIGCHNPWVTAFLFLFWISLIVLIGGVAHFLMKKHS